MCQAYEKLMKKIEIQQSIITTKTEELNRNNIQLRELRSSKTELLKLKNLLQDKINVITKCVTSKTEEVTHIKNKLRYYNDRQIHDNIERLEYQLRNNNYKPREEQKILNEISSLQRSIKTLKEYETRQAENESLRSNRHLLIQERNNNFTKIREIYQKEDLTKSSIANIKQELTQAHKALEELQVNKPALEKEHKEHLQQVKLLRQQRHEERNRLRQEAYRQRMDAEKQRWAEYEASREPFDEERDMCRSLLSYAKSLKTSPQLSTNNTCIEKQHLTPIVSNVQASFTEGMFYSKPKDEDLPSFKLNKKKKAKMKKELRQANKVKELSHPPSALDSFNKLKILPPRNTNDLDSAIKNIEDKLNYYENLAKDEMKAREVIKSLEPEKYALEVQNDEKQETDYISKKSTGTPIDLDACSNGETELGDNSNQSNQSNLASQEEISIKSSNHSKISQTSDSKKRLKQKNSGKLSIDIKSAQRDISVSCNNTTDFPLHKFDQPTNSHISSITDEKIFKNSDASSVPKSEIDTINLSNKMSSQLASQLNIESNTNSSINSADIKNDDKDSSQSNPYLDISSQNLCELQSDINQQKIEKVSNLEPEIDLQSLEKPVQSLDSISCDTTPVRLDTGISDSEGSQSPTSLTVASNGSSITTPSTCSPSTLAQLDWSSAVQSHPVQTNCVSFSFNVSISSQDEQCDTPSKIKAKEDK